MGEVGREGIEPSVTHGIIIIRVSASDTPLLPNQITALTLPDSP
jgi:hypothetical protein